ncbi:hypothetical protein Q8W15_12960 [Photobacterium damselae subsp. piscicida]|nr:hypothetical protein [Photobacterium damselae subsp. piscicida]MDP2544897.1 hypothetical protein [Photobacterium damselae subsp. piscicida]MDP2557950.1 hypothetical protein [Photobacterium damselae subsp. piscicida]
MFIDNPRDNAVTHFTKVYQCTTPEAVNGVKQKLYDDKTEIIQTVEQVTANMDVSSLPLTIVLTGQEGELLSNLGDDTKSSFCSVLRLCTSSLK